MKKEVGLVIILALLLISTLEIIILIRPVRSEPTTIVVPDDYSTIQQAIDVANEGDTVFVKESTYPENVVINKRVLLKGENPEGTIIEAANEGPTVVVNFTEHVEISGFTIRNGSGYAMLNGHEIDGGGIILLAAANYTRIENNLITNNKYGIIITRTWYSVRAPSNHNIISGNNITEFGYMGGILVDAYTSNTTISGNTVSSNNNLGIWTSHIRRITL